jgi:hypothetical protein
VRVEERPYAFLNPQVFASPDSPGGANLAQKCRFANTNTQAFRGFATLSGAASRFRNSPAAPLNGALNHRP